MQASRQIDPRRRIDLLTETARQDYRGAVTEEAVVIVGGTSGIGLRLAETFAARGSDVVITGRDIDRCTERAAAIQGPGTVTPIALDLAEPERIASALPDVGPVGHLVLAAIERDYNSVLEYDIALAIRLVTLKLVGYTEVVHALASRLTEEASILLFGGQALRRPYPGSTTVTTVNGGVTSLVRTLVIELAPTRVNALHPAIVGDSPQWRDMLPERRQALVDRTPIGRLVTMAEVVGASRFLLENEAMNGINLVVDGGWICM
jgi:NAD(P)-dependent dehydrogenase (short-subunit alcohol dehydrogenase family)